ncbi:MAG: hypothetical protein IJL30_06670 [Clostridia bacterium]|nr:hypothetical protein [Clostridia bacterium]
MPEDRTGRFDRLSAESRERLLKIARRLQKTKTTPENLALINETVGNIYTGALSKTDKVKNNIAALASAVNKYRLEHAGEIQDVLTATNNLMKQSEKMFRGEGSTEALRLSAVKYAKVLAEAFGVPVSNVSNMIYGGAINAAKAFGSYEAQYEIMKFRYGINNKSEYYDLIYQAYKNNKTEYQALRKKMINDGFNPDTIDKEIRKRRNMGK